MVKTPITPTKLCLLPTGLCALHTSQGPPLDPDRTHARAGLPSSPCPGPLSAARCPPTISPTTLHFPFVLPLSRCIFRNHSARSPASRAAGLASPFPVQEEGALLGAPGHRLLRVWWGGAWGRRASGGAAPRPSLLCGCIVWLPTHS